ncbi:MAG: hypothetical protein R3F50_01185 [Gammaproteobacteria bacterium]
MDNFGLGGGLAALAFWGFVASAVVASYWDGIRKRESQHETIRRAIESGHPLDDELLEKLSAVTSSGSGRVDRDFKVTALWILPVAAGMVVFAFALGFISSDARVLMLGVAGLLAVLGLGFLAAARYTERWYE